MIPFYKLQYDKSIAAEIDKVLQSGWLTTGPQTKKFEQQITAYCGNEKTLCVSAATNGLEIMLRWFGVGPGDEVIIPAYTYCATANVVVHCGATLVIVDVGDDFNISVDEIERHITPNTKVIMPVDFSGLPCDYDAINSLVSRDGISSQFEPATDEQKALGRILVLADAAHSVGGIYKSKRTGSLTDVSVFSFHAAKNLTTGEGGAICLNLPEPFVNEDVYKALCIKVLHGQSKDALAKDKAGSWRYDVNEAGYKCNMTDLQAIIGMIELDKYEVSTLPARKQIFKQYDNAFSACDWAELPISSDSERNSSYHIYPLRIKGVSEEQRDSIIQQITDDGVGVNVHFMPIPMLSFYKDQGFDISTTPRTYDNYSREITLPVYVDLSEEDQATVIETVIKSVAAVLS